MTGHHAQKPTPQDQQWPPILLKHTRILLCYRKYCFETALQLELLTAFRYLDKWDLTPDGIAKKLPK